MSLFRLLSKGKTRYTFDGREVIITNKGKTDRKALRILTETIKEVCQTSPLAKIFPKLEFIIEPKENKTADAVENILGWVEFNETAEGKDIVHLYDRGVTRDYAKVEKLIVHELTHLWHYHISMFPKTMIKVQKRVGAVAKKNIDLNLPQANGLAYFRSSFTMFFQQIFIEGLAIFSEGYARKEIIFDKEHFTNSHANAIVDIEDFYHWWNFLKEVAEDKNSIKRRFKDDRINQPLSYLEAIRKKGKYTLGYHVIYTIFFVSHQIKGVETTLESISKWKLYELIQVYEFCMLYLNKTPLISYNSGAGKIDYNKILNEWWALAKKIGVTTVK